MGNYRPLSTKSEILILLRSSLMRAILLSAVSLPLILPQASQAQGQPGQKKTVKQRVKKAADKVFIKAVETLAKPGLNRAVREKEAEEAAKSKVSKSNAGAEAASSAAATESLTPEQRKLQAQMEQQNQEAIEKLRAAKAEGGGGERKEAKPRNVTPEQLEKEANRAMDAAEKDRQKTLQEQIDNESPARKEARIKWETARDDPNVPETEKSKLRQAAALALVKDNQRTSEQKDAQRESNLAARKAAAPVVEGEAASVPKATVRDSTPKAAEVGEVANESRMKSALERQAAAKSIDTPEPSEAPPSKVAPKKLSEMSDVELSEAVEKGKYQRIKNADGTVTHQAETRESANAKAELKRRKAAGSLGVKVLGKSPAAVTVPMDEAANESRMKSALERQAAAKSIDTPEPSEAPPSKVAPKKLSEMSDVELSEAVEKGKYQRIKNADGTVTHQAETRESANAKAELKRRKAAGSLGVKVLGKSPAAVTVPMDEAANESRMKSALERQAAANKIGTPDVIEQQSSAPAKSAAAGEVESSAKKTAVTSGDSAAMQDFRRAKVEAQDGNPETAQKRLDAFRKLTLREKVQAIKDGYQEAKDQKAAAKAQSTKIQRQADTQAVETQERVKTAAKPPVRPLATVGAANQGAGTVPERKPVSSRLQSVANRLKTAATGAPASPGGVSPGAPTKLGAPARVAPGTAVTGSAASAPKIGTNRSAIPLKTRVTPTRTRTATNVAAAAVESTKKLQQRKTATSDAAATETTSLKKKATVTKQKMGRTTSTPVVDTVGGSSVKKNVPKTPKQPKQQRRNTNT